MATVRAGQRIFELGLAPSRNKAKRLIEEGAVELFSSGDWLLVKSASQKLSLSDQIRIKESDLLKYVSRSGLKLEGAIQHLELSLAKLICLDVGQSTGGFTDCCLRHGAQHVLGVDVGRDQLHQSLRDDARVEFLEGVNAKELAKHPVFEHKKHHFDFLVCDVSFISVKKVIPNVLFCMKPDSQFLILVKPQFELGAKALGSDGVVKDLNAESLEKAFIQWATNLGLQHLQFFATTLKGQDGNQEFFLYGKTE